MDIFFPADSNHSTMNRYKKGGHVSSGSQKADSKIDLIDLSSISNVNRSPETWDLLEKLSKGKKQLELLLFLIFQNLDFLKSKCR